MIKNVPNSLQHKAWVYENLLYYLISSRIYAISRVLPMLLNFRLASTSPLLALSMSMEIIQPYLRTQVSPPLISYSTPTLPNCTSVLQKHILTPFLLLCSRLLTSHSPSTTFISLLLTTTFGTHFINSTLTPSLTLSLTSPPCHRNVANVPTATYYALLLAPFGAWNFST